MDKHIKRALEEGTENITPSKERVWENIMSQTRQEGSIRSMRKKPSNKIRTWASAAAAIVLAVFFISAPGQAAIQRVIEHFAPEIQIVEDLEGQPEETDASLTIGRAGYIIYFDTDRYELLEMEGKDRIVPILEGDTSYLPDVYMEIEQITDKTPEELSEELERTLRETYLQGQSEFEGVDNRGLVKEPVGGLLIVAQGDIKSSDGVTGFGPVEIIYLVDNEQGGTFIIRQQLFHEAVEGHGQRFDNMLREFKVVPLDE